MPRTPSVASIAILSSAVLFIVAYCDLNSGSEIGLSFFYLLPVGLATWYASRQVGFAFAGLCAITWHAVEVSSGQTYSVEAIGYWNAAIRLGFFITVAYLLNERSLARTDPLTGIANRRRFLEVAVVELTRAARYCRKLSIAYIDLDQFKAINDTFGHYAGDRLLCCVAEVLTNSLRSIDRVFRIGGDEFIVLMPETDLDACRALINRMKTKLEVEVTSNNWAVGFSVGIVTYPGVGIFTIERVLTEADRMMYEAKKDGRNGIAYGVLA